jgi:hypothetical protein
MVPTISAAMPEFVFGLEVAMANVPTALGVDWAVWAGDRAPQASSAKASTSIATMIRRTVWCRNSTN